MKKPEQALEAIFPLVIIDALHPVAVIEQKDLPPPVVDQKAAEEPIEVFEELFASLFIEVDQPASCCLPKLMSFLLEIGSGFGIRKTFT